MNRNKRPPLILSKTLFVGLFPLLAQCMIDGTGAGNFFHSKEQIHGVKKKKSDPSSIGSSNTADENLSNDGADATDPAIPKTGCQIVTPDCPVHPEYANLTFMDAFDGAERSSDRCLKRAREFEDFCNSLGDTSATYVNVGQVLGSTVAKRYHALSDINGDGKSDILWTNGSTGETYTWLGAAIGQSLGGATFESGFVIKGTGDFEGQRKSEILWYSTMTGEVKIGNNPTAAKVLGTVSPEWGYEIVGIGDFDGNSKDDILWYNKLNGDLALWYDGNGAQLTWRNVPSIYGYSVAGVGDFDGDKKADVLWIRTESSDHEVVIWYSGGKGDVYMGNVPASAGLAAVADFNGDGLSDILWRCQNAEGNNIIWYSGVYPEFIGSLPLSTNFAVAWVGDANGDHRADILWQDTSTGQNVLWYGADSGAAEAINSVPFPTTWTITPRVTMMGSTPNPGRVAAVGDEHIFYDSSAVDNCTNTPHVFLDTTMSPVALYKTSDSSVHIRIQVQGILGANYELEGDIGNQGQVSSFTRNCTPIYVSHKNPQPRAFEAMEWLGSPFKLNSQVFFSGAIHSEFALGAYTALTQGISYDSGHSFNHVGDENSPNTFVIADPGHYPNYVNAGLTQGGYFTHTNYVRGSDGFYYMMIKDIRPDGSQTTCSARTPDLAKPYLWRAWNGHGYGAEIGHNERCVGESGAFPSNLSFNKYFQAYLLIGPGVYYLSYDMVHWSNYSIILDNFFGQGFNYASLVDYQYLQNPDDQNAASSATTGQYPLFTHSKLTGSRPVDRQAVSRQIYFAK